MRRRALIALLVWASLAVMFAAVSPAHRGESSSVHHCELCHFGQNSGVGPKVPPAGVSLARAGRHYDVPNVRRYLEPLFLSGITRGPPTFFFAL